MAGEKDKDGPVQPSQVVTAAPKTNKLPTLPGDQFVRFGLVKGSITNVKKTITNNMKEVEKFKSSLEKMS